MHLTVEDKWAATFLRNIEDQSWKKTKYENKDCEYCCFPWPVYPSESAKIAAYRGFDPKIYLRLVIADLGHLDFTEIEWRSFAGGAEEQEGLISFPIP